MSSCSSCGLSYMIFQTSSHIPLFKNKFCMMKSEKTKLFTSILVCRPGQSYSLLDSFWLSGTSEKSTCFPGENRVKAPVQHLYTKSTSQGTSITISDTTSYVSDGICVDWAPLQCSPNAVRNNSPIQGTSCISVYATPISLWLISEAC